MNTSYGKTGEMRRPLRRGRARRATAAVELCVIAPVLATMVFGCIDFGRFAYNYIAVNSAARAGAAYGVNNCYLPAQTEAWQNSVKTVAQNEMSMQTGFVSASLTVTTTSHIDGTGLRRVAINVQYPFSTLVSWPGIPKNTTLQANIMMRSVR